MFAMDCDGNSWCDHGQRSVLASPLRGLFETGRTLVVLWRSGGGSVLRQKDRNPNTLTFTCFFLFFHGSSVDWNRTTNERMLSQHVVNTFEYWPVCATCWFELVVCVVVVDDALTV